MPSAAAPLVNPRVFGRLPPEIRNDKRLSAMTLNTLALLTTFKSYRLRPKHVRKHFGARPGTSGQRNGAGIKAIETAIRRLIDLGYIREIRRGNRMTHEITFKCPEAPHVKQNWFNGKLSPNAVAALIWLRVNPGAHCREVEERFGWTKRAAQYAMAELRDAGMMDKHRQVRSGGGTFGARPYTARLLAAEEVESSPDAHNGVHGTECTRGSAYIEDSLIQTELPLQTGIQQRDVDSSVEPSTLPIRLRDDDGSKELVDPETIAVGSVYERLWGWVDSWDELIAHECDDAWEGYRDLFDEMQQHHLDQIIRDMPLSDILRTARYCAAGRINRRLPGIEVARVVAHTAGCILANEYNEVNDPARALQIVFAHIRTKIGRHENRWINNMAIVAKPVLLKCHSDTFAETGSLTTAGRKLLLTAIKLRTWTVQQDLIGMFAKNFKSADDQLELLKLIQRYGLNQVLAAISALIEQARRQQELRYLPSWRALEDAYLANGEDAVLAE